MLGVGVGFRMLGCRDQSSGCWGVGVRVQNVGVQRVWSGGTQPDGGRPNCAAGPMEVSLRGWFRGARGWMGAMMSALLIIMIIIIVGGGGGEGVVVDDLFKGSGSRV